MVLIGPCEELRNVNVWNTLFCNPEKAGNKDKTIKVK